MSDDLKATALEFVRANPISNLATVEDGAPCCRVMHAFRIDDDFAVWYCCGASSNKVRQIGKNPRACIIFLAGEKDVRICGSAEVVADEQVKADVWEDDWQRFFPGGKDDPEYCVLKITADSVEYRDLAYSDFVPQKVL